MAKVYVPPPPITYYMDKFAGWLAEGGEYKVTITIEDAHSKHTVTCDKRASQDQAQP